MALKIEPIRNGESGLSVREKLNKLIAGAGDGSLGVITVEDLNKLVDTVAPDVTQGLRLSSVLSEDGKVTLIARWNQNPAHDLAYYDLQLREVGGGWLSYPTAGERYEIEVQPTTDYEAQIRAFDKSGNDSNFSKIVAHTTIGDDVPPAMPINVRIAAGFGEIWLDWQPNTEGDLAFYEIYESELSDNPPDEATATYSNITSAHLARTGFESGETRHYWIRAVDRSGNRSPWSARTSATTTALPDFNELLPRDVAPALSAPQLTSRTTLQSDGTTVTTVAVTVSPLDNAVSYVIGITEGQGAELLIPAGDTSFELRALPGANYVVRYAGVNGMGKKGQFSPVASITAVGDTTPPPVPTGLTVLATFKGYWLSWASVSAADLAFYEIYESASADAPIAESPATISGLRATTLRRDGLDAAQSRYHWVRAVDLSGNKSAWSARVGPTVTVGITTVDISGQVTATSFASTIKPVEVVSSLPATGNAIGRQVFLSSDGKVYRFTSAGWTAAVAVTDLSGQIVAAQLADGQISLSKFAAGVRPIESVAVLPTTGNVEGRVVVLVSDGKLYRYTGGSWKASVAATDVSGQITGTQIADASLIASKIADGAVSTTKLATNAIVAEKIAAEAVQATKLSRTAKNRINSFLTETPRDLGTTMASAGLEGWVSGTATNFSLVTDTAINNAVVLAQSCTNTGAAPIMSDRIPIDPSRTYKGNIGLRVVSDGAVGTRLMRLVFYDRSGTLIAPLRYLNTNRVISQANTTYVTPLTQTGDLAALQRYEFYMIPASESLSDAPLSGLGAAIIPANAASFAYYLYNLTTASYPNGGADKNAIAYWYCPSIQEANGGRISADQIDAKLITASKVVLGDTTNLFPDYDIVDPAMWSSPTGTAFTFTNAGAYVNVAGRRLIGSLAANADENTSAEVVSDWFAVERVGEYLVGAGLRSAVPGNIYLDLATMLSDGTIGTIQRNLIRTIPATTSFLTGTATITPVAGQRRARFVFERAAGSTLTGVFIAGAPWMRLKAVGELIVDGTITTVKLAALSITADKIAAGAITVSKIMVTDDTAINADPLFEDASLWNFTGASIASVTGAPAPRVLTAITAVTSTDHTRRYPINEQKTYLFETTARNVGSVAGKALWQLRFYNAAGTVIAPTAAYGWNLVANGVNQSGANLYFPATTIVTPDVWTRSTIAVGPDQAIKIPPAAVAFSAAPWLGYQATTAGEMQINSFRVSEMARGELIVNGAITAVKIDAAAVTTDKLAANAVTAAKIAARTITATEIAVGAITANELGANSVTAGKVAANAIATESLQASAITTDKIVALAITGTKIAGETITGDKLVANTITAREIKALTITANELAANSVVVGKVAAGAIGADQIQANAITATKLAADQAVITGAAQIASAIIGTAHIDSISAVKIAAGSALAGSITVAGTALGTISSNAAVGAQDPAARINAASTQIDPGKITIQGATTLADWRAAGRTTIDGGKIETNSITAVQIAAGTITGDLIAAGAVKATSIAAGAVTAEKLSSSELITLSAQIKDAIITDAKIASLSAVKLIAGSALAGSITVSGTALSTIQSQANDPAARINAAVTIIDPGKIRVSGATTLTSWIKGGDETKIDGGAISANTITAEKAVFGLRGITIEGLEFEHNKPAVNQLSWTAGTIRYINDGGGQAVVNLAADQVTWTAGTLYVYYDKDVQNIGTTANVSIAYLPNVVVLAVYRGGTDLVANYGRTIVDGATIKTGSITATQINVEAVRASVLAANSITASMIAAGSIGAQHLTVSSSGNMLRSSDWSANGDFWASYFANGGSSTIVNDNWAPGMPTWQLTGDNAIQVYCNMLAVVPGQRYQASAYINTHRCVGRVWLQFFASDQSTLVGSAVAETAALNADPQGTNLGSFKRLCAFATAPSNARFARMLISKEANDTGMSQSYLWHVRPLLGEALPNQTVPSPWTPAGVTQISGGMILTNAIQAQHISAQQITTEKLTIGGVTTDRLSLQAATACAIVERGDDFQIKTGYPIDYLAAGITLNVDSVILIVADIRTTQGTGAGATNSNTCQVYIDDGEVFGAVGVTGSGKLISFYSVGAGYHVVKLRLSSTSTASARHQGTRMLVAGFKR